MLISLQNKATGEQNFCKAHLCKGSRGWSYSDGDGTILMSSPTDVRRGTKSKCLFESCFLTYAAQKKPTGLSNFRVCRLEGTPDT